MRISDWSSDVCSSDLQKHLALTGHIYNSAYIVISEAFYQSLSAEQRTAIEEAAKEAGDWQRSESRRVGKECVSTCRSRWSPCHYNKNDRRNITHTSLDAHKPHNTNSTIKIINR